MLMTERWFEAGTISINYATSDGDGPPLVLLHGFMDRWQAFLPLILFLADDWRVIAPDMRGHGRSGRAPDGVYRLNDLVDDMVALIEGVVEGVVEGPAVFLGHSAGAFAAVEIAARHPHLSRAVVVGDMALDLRYLESLTGIPESIAHHREMRDFAGSTAPEISRRLADLQPDMDPAARSAMAESLHQLDPRAVDSHAEGRLRDLLGDFDGDDILCRLVSPVLLIQADVQLGAVMPEEYVGRALALLSDGHHARLTGVGHNLGLDTGNVAPLLQALTPFLQALPKLPPGNP